MDLDDIPGPSSRNIFDTIQSNATGIGDPISSDEYESDSAGDPQWEPVRVEGSSTSSELSSSDDEPVDQDISTDDARDLGNQGSSSIGTSVEETIAKDGSRWFFSEPSSRKAPLHNVFRGQKRVIAAEVDSPYEAFELFIGEDIVNIVVECTNEEGKSVYEERKSEWKPTDVLEIKALLGALLVAGSLNQNMIDTKVLFNEVWGNNFMRSVFSLERFVQLMSCLRFDKKNTRTERRKKDPLAPIRDIWDKFERSLRRNYSPDPFLTIDEQLVPFRGRCKFRMYIPSKPDKYGLKIYWLCESATGYPLKGLPYTGKVGRDSEKGHASNVVMNLAEPFFRTGRNLTFDNFFTDLKLSETLLKNGLTSVGTVKKNKRFIPEPLKHEAMKRQDLYDSKFAFQAKASLVTYKSKKHKSVTILSTMHGDKTVTGEKKKPDSVLFYNSTKNGVDGMDQMVHRFSSKRKTKRWPMVYFTNILDISCLAAFIVFKTIKVHHPLAGKNARSEFIRAVASSLAEGHLRRRLTVPTLSNQLRELISLTINTLGAKKMPSKRANLSSPGSKGSKNNSVSPARVKKAMPAVESVGKKKQQRCSLCEWRKDKKTSTQCDKCKAFVCPDHRNCVCHSCL